MKKAILFMNYQAGSLLNVETTKGMFASLKLKLFKDQEFGLPHKDVSLDKSEIPIYQTK